MTARRVARPIVALATIAGLAVGTLGFALPRATADGSVAVVGTPDVAKLAGPLADQKLTWQTCDFGSDKANERWASQPTIKCASVIVPRDWKNPTNGQTWSIRISQVFNVDPSDAASKGAILVNPGGPGGEGLAMGAYLNQMAPDLRPHYNFIGMDPRGVGQSSHATCEYTWDQNSADTYAELKAIGDQCANNPDVKTINTEQTAYDMDFIRVLLGQRKLSYVGYSYGTWLGAWYGKVFGANAGPMLLDSSTDVTQPTLQKTWDLQPLARDRQFEMRMVNWLARNDTRYGLGTDPQAIRARYFNATAKIDPMIVTLVWMLTGAGAAFPSNTQYPVAGSVIKAIIQFGENPVVTAASSLAADPAASAQQVLDLIDHAGTAEAQAAVAKARTTLASLSQIDHAQSSTTGASMVKGTFDQPFEAIRCGDGQWTQGEAYWRAWAKLNAGHAPLSAQWGSFAVPQCAFWKTSQAMPVATDAYPNTIVIQDEMDSQTAWTTGYDTATKLPNTSAILLDNEGSHGVFPYGTACVDRPVIAFFLTGTMPADVAVCQGLPLPGEATTFEVWSKLSATGQHDGPVVTDPWTPAETAPMSMSMSTEMQVKAAASEATAQLMATIRARYGAEGVKIIEQSGLIG